MKTTKTEWSSDVRLYTREEFICLEQSLRQQAVDAVAKDMREAAAAHGRRVRRAYVFSVVSWGLMVCLALLLYVRQISD